MKNIFSENKKGSKGFYAALGISAVMVGSACYFAYEEGEKLTKEFTANNRTVSEAAVDRQVTNVPKTTAPHYKVTGAAPKTAPPNVAMYPAATVPPTVATIPAAEIQADTPADAPEAAEPVGNAKMENVKAPVSDMGDIIGVFSAGELVKSITTGSWQTHNGTDIGAEVGTEVYAVSNGEIVDVKDDPVWGVTVVLDHHNGYVTRYCGLSDGLEVQKGDYLVSGDMIGTVGNTADIESALSPHLHIELLHNGSYIDPLSEFNK